jgi:4-amino-4-deoxy-L-arabinose transferase-like glycosyltransferase
LVAQRNQEEQIVIAKPKNEMTSLTLTNALEIASHHRNRLLLLLFFGSILVLSPGIYKITSVTDPDEYHRVFRTALTMMERDEWLVPYLDGSPRIRKPPLITWLTRASFEVFGVSLISARIVSVGFAAMFVLSIALIGLELTQGLKFSLTAGA